MGAVIVIFSFFSTDIAHSPPSCPPPLICKTFNIHRRKKNVTLNEKYGEFYFSMGTLLLIFSFFRTDNDLVYSPSPTNSCISPPQLLTYFGVYLKNYSHDFHEILGSGSKQYKGNEFALTQKHDILSFEVGRSP